MTVKDATAVEWGWPGGAYCERMASSGGLEGGGWCLGLYCWALVCSGLEVTGSWFFPLGVRKYVTYFLS